MSLSQETLTLLRVVLQTLAVSALFAGGGGWIDRCLGTRKAGAPASLALSRGFFIGTCAFLAFFVPASRVIGARAALGVAIATLVLATMHEAWLSRRATRAGSLVAAACVLLFAFYFAIDVTWWLVGTVPEGGQPPTMQHVGSLHSGRYANYGWFIAEFDRVPWIAQNGAESILESIHLLGGVDAPLAALMAWIPASATFLTVLLFGLYRSAGASRPAGAAAAFMTMFCNVALSLTHVFVFDNGSPLAFTGYADPLIGVATMILMATWIRDRLSGPRPHHALGWLLPALLAMTWAWYAPHDIAIALGGLVPAMFFIAWRRRSKADAVGAMKVAATIVVAVVVGGLQFGPFLPRGSQESTGLWVQEANAQALDFRPYGQWIHSPFTGNHWNVPVRPGTLETHLYGDLLDHARTIGRDEVFRDVAWLVEEEAWESLRIYGFPILGLVALAAWRRRHGELGEPWLVLSAFAFGCGFAIYFGFELMAMKWWLTRFLVPGTALALTCLSLASAGAIATLKTPARRGAAWMALLAASTFGPVFELATQLARNEARAAQGNTFGKRVAAMMTARAPFLSESLETHAPLAEAYSIGHSIVGRQGGSGVAIETPRMPMQPGHYRASFRIRPQGQAASASASLLTLAATADGAIVAQRRFRIEDLETRAGTPWADLDFDLPRGARLARVSLALEPGASFIVGDVTIRRTR